MPMAASEIRILVADYQRSVRGDLTMNLEATRYRVDATGDGEKVLARCHGRHYDIAFIDINMTKLGGNSRH
jgi:CheY-like chemotaxis protein